MSSPVHTPTTLHRNLCGFKWAGRSEFPKPSINYGEEETCLLARSSVTPLGVGGTTGNRRRGTNESLRGVKESRRGLRFEINVQTRLEAHSSSSPQGRRDGADELDWLTSVRRTWVGVDTSISVGGTEEGGLDLWRPWSLNKKTGECPASVSTSPPSFKYVLEEGYPLDVGRVLGSDREREGSD